MSGKKYGTLETAAERREFLTEYARQIRGQEDALNNLTVDQFRRARESFEKAGRNPDAAKAQADFAREFEKEVKQSIAERIRQENPTLGRRAVNNMAKEKAEEARKGLAALHEPDNVAGGYTSADPTRMGSASVNSAIGPAWPSRVGTLDSWAAAASDAGYGDRLMNVRLFIETGLFNSGR
jgi:filamentous hemagglutinin